MKILLTRSLAFILFCIVATTSCQKEKNNLDTEAPLSLSFDQQEYSLGQLVVLQANRAIEGEAFTGSFGDSIINLIGRE